MVCERARAIIGLLPIWSMRLLRSAAVGTATLVTAAISPARQRSEPFESLVAGSLGDLDEDQRSRYPDAVLGCDRPITLYRTIRLHARYAVLYGRS
jgi:hypothetical protein